MGHLISRNSVNYGSNGSDSFVPSEVFIKALSELTGKSAYKYSAYEILVTLDLEIYKAIRRLIVPANIEFAKLHKLLQKVFEWKNCHLYDFAVFDDIEQEPVAVLVIDEESLEYGDNAVLMDRRKLSDYFPKYKHILYTYYMGDSWEHQIELIRVIDEHNEESPYLLEASGQTPPEDVGGVYGFINFREIMLNTNHHEYAEMKEWVGYWSPELPEWDIRPKMIHC